MLNIRSLQIVASVARLGGFSKAAREVHAVQSTVSKAVQSVEEYFDIQIFERLQHGVRLTVEGEILCAHANTILATFTAMQRDAQQMQALQSGELRLGFPPVASGVLFAESLAQYSKRYPGISIQTQEQGCASLEPLVLAGSLELALSLLPVSEDFSWLPIRDEPLLALLPPSFPLEGRSSLKLNDLAHSPFIWFEERFLLNERITTLCRQRHFTLKECMRTGQVDFLITLVSSDVGVGLLPRIAVEQRDLPPNIRLALLDEHDLRWQAAMIWRKGRPLSNAAQAWLQLMHETYALPKTLPPQNLPLCLDAHKE